MKYALRWTVAMAAVLLAQAAGAVELPRLAGVGEDYDFVIFADPQVSHASNRGFVAMVPPGSAARFAGARVVCGAAAAERDEV